MSATASKLDTEKFRKVHVMMTGGATPGERSAAKARAEAMATKAGMSLKQAVSSLSAKPKAAPSKPAPKPQPSNFFDGFDDWCEAREPGYKAKRAAEKAERDARDAVKRAEVLGQYGSEDALFDFTPNEKALREAVKPIAGWGHWTDNQGKRHYYAKTLDGIKPKHGFWSVEEITPTIRAAVQGAYPWPTTLRDAFAEVVAWDELRDARSLFTGIGDCDHHAEVECRIQLLQHDLAIGVPAASWDDVQTRFDWFGYRDKWGLVTSGEMMARLQADFNVLRDLSAPELGSANVAQPEGVSPELRPLPRTTAEKRAAILSMLDREPGLSSREIARRLGISPQTVSTWRKAK